MVYRCFAEKKAGFDIGAQALTADLRGQLGLTGLGYIRILNRYDIEDIEESVYKRARGIVFSEPPCDELYDETPPDFAAPGRVLAVEALPGQYDQRADSCAQCLQLLAGGERPPVRVAKVFLLGGQLSDGDFERVKAYLINPVETREASMDKPQTLHTRFELPGQVEVITGFIRMNEGALTQLHRAYGLAMDLNDLLFLQEYFVSEDRDPTVTELRVADTYWSDHCRHTTFSTRLDDIECADERVKRALDSYLSARNELYGQKADDRPVTLMDIATAASKLLYRRGLLPMLDISDEINACTVKTTIEVDGEEQDWLLLFKNETHNHPTEIEPFGGAATCIGGAIRDPLSGRAYVYQAMRVTGAGDPRVPMSQTLEGKLPQRKLTTTASSGYSSYGNQIGLATGLVHEIYHPGYVAKRMEIGAVVGAAPAQNVVRLNPLADDVVVLLGGRTGRDGIGGATGSSKTHTLESLNDCAAEVQKGNAPEERKIQRLFRDRRVTRMIKRCNDFGAGGVSVAIGELADGLYIELDKVPKKYEGLDGTELAISESQERMAVVIAPDDLDAFIACAHAENLEATPVARVTAEPRLKMEWNGRVIVDLTRAFLSSNGAPRHARIRVEQNNKRTAPPAATDIQKELETLAASLEFCSRRGLIERFDASIGAGSVFMPFGGKTQRTPAQTMAALFPVLSGNTTDCSVMSFGFDPSLSERDPFAGAACAVVESLSKLAASGCDTRRAYLTFQEYFERLREDPKRWGKPFSALLGAFSAQLGLGVAAIGGKDSMSGSFLELDVPPTLVSFSIAQAKAEALISAEFKGAGHPVYLFKAPQDADGLPDYPGLRKLWDDFYALCTDGQVLSAWACERGGPAGGILKMSFGNNLGFTADAAFTGQTLFEAFCGSIIAECADEQSFGQLIGYTTQDAAITICGACVPIKRLHELWEGTLEGVFPVRADAQGEAPALCYERRNETRAIIKTPRPRAVIPVFPGTNCEYDTARALARAGAEPEILIVRNLTGSLLEESAAALEQSIRRSQMLILPGGFSGGDEPDGSGKFIAAFLRNARIADAINELLRSRDGLILGICNGFQALIKLGLVPFGEIRDMDDACPTLTFNRIGRHQSRYVYTRVSSVKSPWLSLCQPGQVHCLPVSHGEGRFAASQAFIRSLSEQGQIAFQYADAQGQPSMDIEYNPNGSIWAVEGITSPDGRVLGKMCHTERRGDHVARNVPGEKFQPLFEGGVRYFK